LTSQLFEAGGVAVGAAIAPSGPAVLTTKPDFRVTVLDEFAAEIRAGHLAIQAAMSNALDIALHTGDTLLAARDRISKRWIEWLEKDCKINRKTAHLYMKLAHKRDEIEKAQTQIPDLSLRGAYRLITRGPSPAGSANEGSNKDAGEDSNKSEEPESSPLDRLLTTTPASEVAVEFAKRCLFF
jgi:hypothetical protein